MKLVPILEENIDFIRLDLTRHYLQIDCDFTCFIVLNPSGSIPTGGTDICALHVGAWQVDAWSFLTDKFTKGVAGFSACLVWDKTLITSIYKAPQVAESDIDTANSISSLKGQPVNITGFSMAEGESLPVKTLDENYVAVKTDSNVLSVQRKTFVLKVGDTFNSELVEKYSNEIIFSGDNIKVHLKDFECKLIDSFELIFNGVPRTVTDSLYLNRIGNIGGYYTRGFYAVFCNFVDVVLDITLSGEVVSSLFLTAIGSRFGHLGGYQDLQICESPISAKGALEQIYLI